jgi:hypothetical protein
VHVTCEFVGKYCFESPRLILIVQHYYRHYAQLLIASAAIRHFALQVLQKTVRKMILRPLAAGILLSPFAAVGTDIFDPVLLRIAVQSRPTGAAHADYFRISPFHRFAS